MVSDNLVCQSLNLQTYFKLANLLTDTKVLEKTQEAVRKLVEEDKKLEKPENIRIRNELYSKYGEQLSRIVG